MRLSHASDAPTLGVPRYAAVQMHPLVGVREHCLTTKNCDDCQCEVSLLGCLGCPAEG